VPTRSGQSLENENEKNKNKRRAAKRRDEKTERNKPSDKFHEQNEMSTVNLPYTFAIVVCRFCCWSVGWLVVCLLVVWLLVVGFWADYFLF